MLIAECYRFMFTLSIAKDGFRPEEWSYDICQLRVDGSPRDLRSQKLGMNGGLKKYNRVGSDSSRAKFSAW